MRILSSKSWASTALALVWAILIASYPAPSQAIVDIVVQEQGSDVVVSVSGTLDLSGLTKADDYGGCYGAMDPAGGNAPFCTVGPDSGNSVPCDGYSGTINGPTSFGSGTTTVVASSGSSTEVGLYANASQVIVPDGYTSGSSLSGSSSTYSGHSFSSLGLTAGTYTWTWGSGSNQDSIILKIGADPIPTLNEWAMILLSILLVGSGVIILRRRSANGSLAK